MTREVSVSLANLTRTAVKGRVTLRTWLPSLTAPWADFTAGPGGTAMVKLPVTARDDLEWGRKTVALVVDVDGKEAFFWRPLLVVDQPHWKRRGGGRGPRRAARAGACDTEMGQTATVTKLQVLARWEGGPADAEAGRVWSGRSQCVGCGAKGEVEIRYEMLGQQRSLKASFGHAPVTVTQTPAPADALAAIVVARAGAEAGQMVSAQIKPEASRPTRRGRSSSATSRGMRRRPP